MRHTFASRTPSKLCIWSPTLNTSGRAFQWRRVSEWLLFNANSAIFQLYHGENNLIFNERVMRSALFKTNTLSWIFVVLAHSSNSPRVDMSLHSDTLFWFRVNQSLLFLLNTACLAGKQQISLNFIVFGSTRPRLEPTIYHTRSERANHYAIDVVMWPMSNEDPYIF